MTKVEVAVLPEFLSKERFQAIINAAVPELPEDSHILSLTLDSKGLHLTLAPEFGGKTVVISGVGVLDPVEVTIPHGHLGYTVEKTPNV